MRLRLGNEVGVGSGSESGSGSGSGRGEEGKSVLWEVNSVRSGVCFCWCVRMTFIGLSF